MPVQEMLPTVESSFCVCKFCGEKIEGKHKSAVFCSDACRLRWFRFKHKVVLCGEDARKAVSSLIWFTNHPDTKKQAWAYLLELQFHLTEIIDIAAKSDVDWLR